MYTGMILFLQPENKTDINLVRTQYIGIVQLVSDTV